MHLSDVCCVMFVDEKFYYNILCGVVSGAVAAALCNPTDLLKVSMENELMRLFINIPIIWLISLYLYSITSLRKLYFLGSHASSE